MKTAGINWLLEAMTLKLQLDKLYTQEDALQVVRNTLLLLERERDHDRQEEQDQIDRSIEGLLRDVEINLSGMPDQDIPDN